MLERCTVPVQLKMLQIFLQLRMLQTFVQLRMLQTFGQLRYCRVLVQVGYQAQTRCIETGCRAQQQCRSSQHRRCSYISNSEMQLLLRCQKHAIVSGNNADCMSAGQTEDCMAYIVQLIKSTSDRYCAV